MENPQQTQLARISAKGVVQGVGFRPFVFSLAKQYGLSGWVCNTSEDVKIEVEGPGKNIDHFISDLEHKAPPLAKIETISVSFDSPVGYDGFEIRQSKPEAGKYQLVSPDIATCDACQGDVFTPGNRRFHYPFTNCTNCGPRFTIIKDIPYDRPLTTMSAFTMCPDCQREYQDPLDRRFHAQPNACPICGPALQLTDNSGSAVDSSDIIASIASLLKQGKIVAIKGLGGFLLACDATSEKSVTTLRKRKRRPSKPFAVMVTNIEMAHQHCKIGSTEEMLLMSPQSPIVLLPWKPSSTICRDVGYGLKYLGVMLPYTPLHHLILRETGLPLVMTSGNISEEPIAGENAEALRRLHDIADYFLLHNRDIHSTYDDSVAIVAENVPVLVRRSRGYAPYPIHLDYNSPQILACGAEEKNTFCLTRDNHAFVSQHIGDMENLETMEHYERTVELYKRLFRIQPEIIAYDMHPEYLPTRYALDQIEKTGIAGFPVQHHHAHIASCMTDAGAKGPVIGLAFDGTGYGSDGKIWGGEFLIVDRREFKRVGQLEYLPLPGGDAAIKKPYRIAIAYMLALLGEKALDTRLGFLHSVEKIEIDLIRKQIQSSLNSPLTSSMGRLFDAVSAMANIRPTIDYEAQAAIDMEMQAYDAEDEQECYPFGITGDAGCRIIRLRDLIAAVLSDVARGCRPSAIGMRFHNTIAVMAHDICLKIRENTGLETVALSGGCFQNRLLLSRVTDKLKIAGFSVLTHSHVPCNDGGISLGQAVITSHQQQ